MRNDPWLPVALVIALLVAPNVTFAQESLPAPESLPAMPPLPPDNTDANLDAQRETRQMYDTMMRLKKGRRSLTAEFRAPQQSTAQGKSSRSRGNRDVANLKRKLERDTADIAERSQRIGAKLERLRSLVRNGGLCQLPPSDATASQTIEELPPSDNLSQNVVDARAADRASPGIGATDGMTDTAPATVAASPNPPPSNKEPRDATPSVVPDSVIQALTMVDGPVDPLSFANNLYGSGEYQLALEIYQKIDRSQISQQAQVWVEFQLANCYRQLGNPQAAERGYRIVTRRDKQSWVGKNARWWLVIGDESRQLQGRSERMRVGLNALKGEKNGTAVTR